MSYPVYPEYPIPDTPVKMEVLYNIVRGDVSFNFSYKRLRSFRRKRKVTLSYSWLTYDEIKILQEFYTEVMYGDGLFYFKFPTTQRIVNEYLGQYDLATDNKIFDLPAWEYSNLIVRQNGEPISAYKIYTDTFPYKIEITNYVHNGDLFTIDYEGKPLLIMEFSSSSLGLEALIAGYSNISDLELLEVLNA